MGNLEVHELTKYFGKQPAIDNVSFTVDDNEFFVILGAQRSGKTTLLRLIAGLEKPNKGKVILNGQEITRLTPAQRNIAMTFQNTSELIPTMNVYDNIAFVLKQQRIKSSGIEMHIVAAAHHLGITHLLERKLDNLSGGERQRVALARILVKKAQLYLFDEPLLHLDTTTHRQVRQEISMVHRLGRQPSIYMAHNQEEAFVLGKRIAILLEGRIQQIGAREELFKTPANIEIAQFIGNPAINILEGYLQYVQTPSGFRFCVLTKDLKIVLSEKWNPILIHQPYPEVLLGIRPDALLPEWMLANSSEQPDTLIRSQLVRTERFENKLTLFSQTGPYEQLTVVTRQPDIALQTGQLLTMGINTEELCIFDGRTRQLIKPVKH